MLARICACSLSAGRVQLHESLTHRVISPPDLAFCQFCYSCYYVTRNSQVIHMPDSGLGLHFVSILRRGWLYGKFSARPLGTENRLVVSNISEMSRIQKTGLTLVALFFVGVFVHEWGHFCRYGHLAPLGLHADVSITMTNEVLGVEGTAKIYRAKLTNYGILPSTLVSALKGSRCSRNRGQLHCRATGDRIG
jgi:hypothetical protein